MYTKVRAKRHKQNRKMQIHSSGSSWAHKNYCTGAENTETIKGHYNVYENQILIAFNRVLIIIF